MLFAATQSNIKPRLPLARRLLLLSLKHALTRLCVRGIFEVISQREIMMNQDQAEGNWKQLKGKAQQKWGDLTNDDLDKMEGNRTELVGKIQEKYGKSKEEAQREVDEFFDN
jgi:uncharacterized protein YjbJ (UPF0337 family)